jgi:tetratricopeptide (TPR) repeat protein
LPGTPPPIEGDSASVRVAIERINERMGAGDFEGARNLANAQVGGPRSGQAQWQLGLIAYRLHDYAEAVRQFEASSQWRHHGGWALAGAHYWAARSRLAAGETSGVTLHLEAAAQRPWTFYGQLAETQLGRDSILQFNAPEVNEDTVSRFIERYPAARRAAALAQLGRLSEVESELRRLHADLPPEDDRAFLTLAIALEAPAAQLRAAEFGGRDMAAGFCPSERLHRHPQRVRDPRRLRPSARGGAGARDPGDDGHRPQPLQQRTPVVRRGALVRAREQRTVALLLPRRAGRERRAAAEQLAGGIRRSGLDARQRRR